MSKVAVREDPKLSEIVEAISEHQREFPDHGIACACLDDVIQTVRNATTVGTLRERLDSDELWAIQSRIEYVFILANRRY